ncbi:MAG: hypothetical protein S4CHLAM123_05100 [Chlamydiales bacterium]|nr:hypothetical protein [Chlamydiales bacterium]
MPLLEKQTTGLWVVDVQEKIFPLVDRSCQVMESICFAIRAARALGLSIFVTEQYPQGLGNTLSAVKNFLPEGQQIYSKTTFSGYRDPSIIKAVDETQIQTWILIGVEAHVCVLQTAKDLIYAKKNVIVLNDAVSSRSLFDFSTAMGELRDAGSRLSSSESVFYELIGDAASADFKSFLPLVKAHVHP